MRDSMLAMLLAAALGGVPPVAQREPAPAVAGPAQRGRLAYEQYCASCHGADLRGGPNAPSIRGAGAADVDFMVSTGRMPAAVPWVEVGHRGAQFSQATIDAIVAYITSVAPGGPEIPVVVAGGDAGRGQVLFRQNCMHCHGIAGAGGAIGGEEWAPSLNRATVTQVGEAIRVGPGEMPRFGARQLSERDVDDIVTYLSASRASAAFDGLPVRTGGPVPEGLVGWLVAGLLAGVAYASTATGKEKT